MSTLIEAQLLGADANDITFTSIPSTYRDLWLLLNVETDDAVDFADNVEMQLGNGSIDTGNNYSWQMRQDGTSDATTAANATSLIRVGLYSTDFVDAGTYSCARIEINDYADTATFKNVTYRGGMKNGSGQFVFYGGGMWSSVSAIDTIKLFPNVGTNLTAGSRAALYGIP